MLQRLIVFVLLLTCFASTSVVQASTTPRLRFATGQKHIVVTGYLSQRHTQRTYRYYGKAGQHLKIVVQDLGHTGEDLVTSYHIAFPSGKTFGEKGYDPFDGKLTETGTYYIVVGVNLMASNASSGRFRLHLYR